ncbi:hypothetical protein CCACVL1_25524 [Corchorus capsularis]|uniref:Uncharacterized protein n=1 Tax=Corchorus capsularis TaxID=210143 RepID=A0A1R3GJL1_COCAP|nr:hypothetical protein CCACVL1_25524 [Corchorus capsularis]
MALTKPNAARQTENKSTVQVRYGRCVL